MRWPVQKYQISHHGPKILVYSCERQEALHWQKLPVDLVKDTEDMSTLYVVDSQKGMLAEVRLHYPASVKEAAAGYTNLIAVELSLLSREWGYVYWLDLHSKLQVKVEAMKKAVMEAFVARHEVHVDYQHG